MLTHRRAIELLIHAQVFCPAVVPNLGGGGYIVYSAMKVLGQGETIEAAFGDAKAKGNLPQLPAFPSFRGDGRNVLRRGEVIATASSRTMADRIANALNQYNPNERGI